MSRTRKVSDVSGLTPDGAAWLASAGTYPRSTLALWEERPDAPLVLPCGAVFDVVSAPALFGRRMLDRMWDEGPGSGPVAQYRGRIQLFAAPGTAQRLPALLEWEEWGTPEVRGGPDGGLREAGRAGAVPPLLCHGTGDAVTVPPAAGAGPQGGHGARWLVAPDTRHPWLPGPEVLLWAAVRAARAAVRISIFPPADQDANVYDVSRRR
ncbi:bifunctional DNA primase/polymerase [Streptomyces sp. H28]|uniref:bifunctional DNA primase/polymerase n=1 Tax=Streptomyces sp. H28 TaxID=2775865 RepID=UPI001781137C|nr:bifunctional DNA primase/polymerase [Streptomyces sp. H28]MBD9732398.1 bifunctional DNA primase/polymerase [Streptomyces sp. H28]